MAACHPLPTAAVTGFAAVLGVGLGLPAPRVLLVAIVVLLGQLSIGWVNDYVDRDRDAAVGRTDKPVAAGSVAPRLAAVAAGVAALASLALGVTLGPQAALLNLAVVASGWAYDLGLKTGVLSPLPYAVAFGSLPALVARADGDHGPVTGLVLTGALLGVGAHFANTVRDARDDAVTGVHGLPQRLGPARSLLVSAVLMGLAAVTVLATVRRTPVAVTLAVLAVLASAACVAGGLRARAEVSALGFRLALVSAACVLAAFVLGVR